MLWIAIIRKSSVEKPNYAVFWRQPISIALVFIMCYYILEVLNPAMKSYIGWLFFVRKQVSFLLFYFIAYTLLNSFDKVLAFLKFWIVLALVIALYGIKQQ